MMPIIQTVAGLLVRACVGLFGHSGQNNDHNGGAAYGGDYEAQRHWMEITYHLPAKDWYYYDLEYWGLDYPPITAYVSWISGFFSELLCGEASVALDSSRGYEDPDHKSYMRATVLVLDVIVYFSAVWRVSGLTCSSRDLPDGSIVFSPKSSDRKKRRAASFFVSLLQPAIVLIDHGHFQYNTTALGLSLWAFYFFSFPDTKDKVIGAIFFTAALNFKQMTLYYAPAVFFFLLGWCFSAASTSKALVRFSALGGTVILCFLIIWAPFIASNTALQVLKRQFPFQRGLFEGKVANIWCALTTKPISFRSRVDEDLQPIISLFLTLCLLLPVCIKLFFIALKSKNTNPEFLAKKILLGTSLSAVAFFLASFQVHEKSILIALAPFSLLQFSYDKWFTKVEWFSLICAWTLLPLMTVDKLVIPMVVCVGLYLMVGRAFSLEEDTDGSGGEDGKKRWKWFVRYAR